MSEWRDARNAAATARLHRTLPAAFPPSVLAHAIKRPFVPPTPRRAVESYWRHHPLRADHLARALAQRSGAPDGWAWREAAGPGAFRMPPAPFRHPAHARGPGHCCVCGQPVFRFGWHRDLWGDGRPNARAEWHAACVVAWKLWCAPADHLQPLKRRQGRRCADTGRRLLKGAEVDHRVPLFAVWRDHHATPWPELLRYWGVPNLGVVNRDVHRAKSVREGASRAEHRRMAREGAPTSVG